jgi:hypothetical protein
MGLASVRIQDEDEALLRCLLSIVYWLLAIGYCEADAAAG